MNKFIICASLLLAFVVIMACESRNEEEELVQLLERVLQKRECNRKNCQAGCKAQRDENGCVKSCSCKRSLPDCQESKWTKKTGACQLQGDFTKDEQAVDGPEYKDVAACMQKCVETPNCIGIQTINLKKFPVNKKGGTNTEVYCWTVMSDQYTGQADVTGENKKKYFCYMTSRFCAGTGKAAKKRHSWDGAKEGLERSVQIQRESRKADSIGMPSPGLGEDKWEWK